ncbi:hypothetical protein DICPUDRAFT_15157, partial [Dictyostelium purpureum]
FFNLYKAYLLLNIKDVSFLYNNLDVRNQSVGNTIYFTLEGADPKTPFLLRLPINEFYDGNPFYPKEYYSRWNSDKNKFQIDFVVPKNCRLGIFKYSIVITQTNTVSSEFFPESSQLIIKKSNFDGIGPVFTNVEKIPFADNKFGWRLTISDPINGFDNGTITVTGSEDNSIYKFNLLPSNMKSGNISEGIWEIFIDLAPNHCIDQNYIITFVKLYDTGALYTVFELSTQTMNQTPNQIINPFYLLYGDSTINKISINQCEGQTPDTTPPTIENFSFSTAPDFDVGSSKRKITFELQVKDPESGINTYAQGPIIYLLGENFDMVECITKFEAFINNYYQFKCSIETPVGLGSTYGRIHFSIYGIINNHGLYKGYDTSTLMLNSIDVLYSLTAPILFDTGIASSRGGEYFVYGRALLDSSSLIITDTLTNQSTEYSNIKLYGSSVISISNLNATTNNFYVSVKSKSGLISNKLLVSPLIFNSYTPEEESSSGDETPLPTNAPQQCFGEPLCGGPTHGSCNNQTGCVCIYPWRGKSCNSHIVEPEIPVPNPNEPSTEIQVPNDNIQNTLYKSLISLVSLRELDYKGTVIKTHPFDQKWQYSEITKLKSNYLKNLTTSADINTTISTTLEWFNETKATSFAGQDFEMYANSIKYSIEISKYPFVSPLNSLQLIMSATFSSNSSDSCSFREYGDTTSGDNSNYIKVQIDNKSLYGRFIKRGIINDKKIVSLSNIFLDSSMNRISSQSESQSYIGIIIPQFSKNAIIDPDFSVLLDNDFASSNPDSICKSKGLSGAKIAGIVIGSFAFVAIVVICV